MEFFTASLRIRERLGHEHGVAVTSDSIGTTPAYLGKFEEAVRFHLRAIDMFEAAENRAAWAMTMNDLAYTLTKKDDPAEAANICTQAIEVCEELQIHPALAAAKGTLIGIQLGSHRYDEAVQTCQQVLAMPPGHRDSCTEGSIFIDCGEAFRCLGDVDAARDVWRSALEVLERDGDPRAGDVRARLGGLSACR
jgi:tetratricopeptide (TPR) repeat protein